jgi:tungstate transport system substrate-binding protein
VLKKIVYLLTALPLLVSNNITMAQDKFIIVASTTSTQDSGLFKHILPMFTSKTGVDVRIVAQGTGQALAAAKRGDADVVLVHDKAAELKFVNDGFGIDRRDVMYNDFVLVGPKVDAAKIELKQDIVEALKTIALRQAHFVSRGDKSGTHNVELRYWALASIDSNQRKGTWYKETGSGMGASLNIASSMNAYTLTDRGTWLSFKNRGELKVLIEGDSKLFNQYGVMLVNPQRHPHVKRELGQQFITWLTSSEGQNAIASFKIADQAVFFPNFKN